MSEEIRLVGKDVAKIVRKGLKEMYPTLPTRHFSVKSKVDSITVEWDDFPNEDTIQDYINQFVTSGFDGMTDSSYSIDKKYEGKKLIGIRFANVRRNISNERLNKIQDIATEQYNDPLQPHELNTKSRTFSVIDAQLDENNDYAGENAVENAIKTYTAILGDGLRIELQNEKDHLKKSLLKMAVVKILQPNSEYIRDYVHNKLMYDYKINLNDTQAMENHFKKIHIASIHNEMERFSYKIFDLVGKTHIGKYPKHIESYHIIMERLLGNETTKLFKDTSKLLLSDKVLPMSLTFVSMDYSLEDLLMPSVLASVNDVFGEKIEPSVEDMLKDSYYVSKVEYKDYVNKNKDVIGELVTIIIDEPTLLESYLIEHSSTRMRNRGEMIRFFNSEFNRIREDFLIYADNNDLRLPVFQLIQKKLQEQGTSIKSTISPINSFPQIDNIYELDNAFKTIISEIMNSNKIKDILENNSTKDKGFYNRKQIVQMKSIASQHFTKIMDDKILYVPRDLVRSYASSVHKVFLVGQNANKFHLHEATEYFVIYQNTITDEVIFDSLVYKLVFNRKMNTKRIYSFGTSDSMFVKLNLSRRFKEYFISEQHYNQVKRLSDFLNEEIWYMTNYTSQYRTKIKRTKDLVEKLQKENKLPTKLVSGSNNMTCVEYTKGSSSETYLIGVQSVYVYASTGIKTNYKHGIVFSRNKYVESNPDVQQMHLTKNIMIAFNMSTDLRRKL